MFSKKSIRYSLLVFISFTLSNCGWLGGVFKGGATLSGSNNNSQIQDPGNTQTPPGNNNGSGNPSLLVNVAQPVVSGVCTPANVVARNASGQISSVIQNTVVNLVYPSGIAVYSSANCSSGSVITQTTIPQGSAASSFYIQSNAPGSYAVTATVSPATDYDPHTLNIVVANPSYTNIPIKIGLSGGNVVAVGSCAPFLSTFLTSTDTPTVFNNAVTVSLSGAGVGGGFYSDAACTNAISSYNVAAGAPNGAFYFKSNSIGAPILVAVASGISGSLPVYVERGAPDHLSFFGPTAINNQECVAFGVVIRDVRNNAVVTTNNISINLTKGSAEPGEFYADQNCSVVASAVTILSFNSSQLFYYKSTDGGTANLRASAALIPNDGTMSLLINQANPGSPSRLFISVPTNQTSAGTCFGPLNVSVRDSGLNVIPGAPVANVLLSTSGSGSFYSDSGCGTSVTTVNSGANFYFRDLVAETTTLKADHNVSTPLYASDTKGLTLNAGPATQVKLTGLATTFVAGQCYELKVVYQDAFGNATTLASAVDVQLSKSFNPFIPHSGSPTPTGKFYASSNCSSALPTPSGQSYQLMNMAAGLFEKSVYYRETLAGNGTLFAADGVLNPGSYNFNVVAGVPTQILVEGPTSIPSGTCGVFNVLMVDAFFNSAAAVVDTNLLLTQNPALGSYYASPTCAGAAVTQTVIAQGTMGRQIGFTPSVAGPQNGTGTAQTITPAVTASFPINVIPAGPSSLRILAGAGTPASGGTGLVGVCYPFIVDVRTPANQAMTVTSDLSVALLPTGFYGDSNCTLPTTQATILTGSGSVTVYFKSTVATAQSLSAASTGLTGANYTVNFSAGSAVGLQMAGAALVQAGSCSDVVQVKAVDVFGNFTALPSMNLALGGNPSNVSYYNGSDSTCSQAPIGNILVATGSVGESFRVKSTVAQVFTMTATGGSLAQASKQMTISVGAYSTLALSTGSITQKQLACSAAITARQTDAFGNPIDTGVSRTIGITPSGGVSFYSDAACSVAATSTAIASVDSAPVYAKGLNVGSFAQVFNLDGVSSTLTANITLLDCRSASAVVSNTTAQFSWTDMEHGAATYYRYIAIKSMFPTWAPYGRAGGSTGGVAFAGDDATHQAMCNFMGYQSATGTRVTNSWSSCGDNGSMRFNPTTKVFYQEAACSFNSHTNRYDCVGKLAQSCYDDPTWIAR